MDKKEERWFNPYEVLGIHKGTSEKEIDQAWGERYKKARRGKIGHSPEEINKARNLLKDIRKRAWCDLFVYNFPLVDLSSYRSRLSTPLDKRLEGYGIKRDMVSMDDIKVLLNTFAQSEDRVEEKDN